MSDEIVLQQQFQERVFARIRDSIGELMTDAELKALLNAAFQKAFFEPAIQSSGYGTVRGDSAFIIEIRKLMEPKVSTAMKEWLRDNPELVRKAIDDAIAKGFFGLVQQHLEQQMSLPLQEFANRLRQNGVLG